MCALLLKHSNRYRTCPCTYLETGPCYPCGTFWGYARSWDDEQEHKRCQSVTSPDCEEAGEIHDIIVAAAMLADLLGAPLQTCVDALWPCAMIQHVYARYEVQLLTCAASDPSETPFPHVVHPDGVCYGDLNAFQLWRSTIRSSSMHVTRHGRHIACLRSVCMAPKIICHRPCLGQESILDDFSIKLTEGRMQEVHRHASGVCLLSYKGGRRCPTLNGLAS